jgi:hypothetical protein
MRKLGYGKFIVKLATLAYLALLPIIARSETVDVFFDSTIAQVTFAANDIKTALQSKNFTVEMLNISSLGEMKANKKIVLSPLSNSLAVNALVAQAGIAPTGLGEQAYALRTTSQGQLSFWVMGGDVNGTMYGGLQLAENIRFSGMTGTYNSQETPYIKGRGVKFNIPLDARCPTYYSAGTQTDTYHGSVMQNAIPSMWDYSYWTAWFDEMARHRFNVLSLWNLHPFPALLNMPEYPDIALQDVKGFNGYTKTMSINEKIIFWKKVMAYGRDRGFNIYLIDWSIYTDGATGKYGIDNNSNNAATVTYMRKCVTQLFETYPDLTGFGVTSGENMGSISSAEKEKWMWSTIGQGMYDYAKTHPTRKITFIHRYHETSGPDVVAQFKPLFDLPNVNFDMSYKYSKAHMYSAPDPSWITTVDGDIPADLAKANLKTWLEVRNEDFFLLHWGDPVFARAYLAGIPDNDKYIQGFFYGSDGWVNARVFASKDALYQGDLEIRRLWYTQMLWGRLSYNPNTPDAVFINEMARKYPGISASTFFNAWSMASKGVPLFTEVVQGTWSLDFHWWPEACLSSSGFHTIDQMAATNPTNGSSLCSVSKSATAKCGALKTTYKVADEIEAASQGALDLIGNSGGGANTALQIDISNLRAMSYLGLYYAEKLRGATYLSAGQTAPAQGAMAKAECNWKSYSSLMSSMYVGMKMHRVDDFADWHAMDASVLTEVTKLGGKSLTNCQVATVAIEPKPNLDKQLKLTALASGSVSFFLPSASAYTLNIYSTRGIAIKTIAMGFTLAGSHRVKLDAKLDRGIYFVKFSAKGKSMVKKMQMMQD